MTAPRTPRPELFIFAFDHRDPFFELARATGADERRMPALKQLFVRGGRARPKPRAVSTGRIGLLCDDRYGQDALNAATGRGWWIGRPVEWPGSNPVVFEHGRSIGTTLVAWPVEHVVKCLVPFHPDDDVDNRLENEAQVRALYDAVQASGHELLIEIVPPKHLPHGPGRPAARDEAPLQPRHLSRSGGSCRRRRATEWPALDALIAERDPYCRGVVLLGLNAPIDELARGFADAAESRTLPRLRGRPHDLRRAGARVARGTTSTTPASSRPCATNFEALIDAWRDGADRERRR